MFSYLLCLNYTLKMLSVHIRLDSGCRKISARWVPRLLSDAQKSALKDICQQLLNRDKLTNLHRKPLEHPPYSLHVTTICLVHWRKGKILKNTMRPNSTCAIGYWGSHLLFSTKGSESSLSDGQNVFLLCRKIRHAICIRWITNKSV